MARTEDLKKIPLGVLLGTLCQKGKPGILTVSTQRRRQRVFFDGVNISLLESSVVGRRRLGEILVSAGLISDYDLQDALTEQKKSLRYLGDILVDRGTLSQRDLDRVLQLQIEEELNDLFSAQFCLDFDQVVEPQKPSDHSRPIPLDEAVIAAAERIDEWNTIKSRMPDFTAVFQCQVDPAEWPEEEEAKILTRLNGRRTLQSVADSLLRSPLHVAKIIDKLLQQNAVRKSSPKEMLQSAAECIADGQMSLATAVLHEVRQLKAGAEFDEQVAELFCKAGDVRSAAQVRIGLARLSRVQGAYRKAQDYLDRAHRDCPNSAEILRELAELARSREDTKTELAHLQTLIQRAKSSEPRAATNYLGRLLELTPEDYEARNLYVELCIRTEQDELAVQALEAGVVLAKKKSLLPRAADLSTQLLKLDGSRGDIRRDLSQFERQLRNRRIRTVGVAVLTLGLVGAGAWYLVDRQKSQQAIEQVSSAAELINQGRLDEARRTLDSTDLNVASEEISAAAVAEKLERKMGEETRLEYEQQVASFEQDLDEVELLVQSQHYGAAMKELTRIEQTLVDPELRDRARIKIEMVSEQYREMTQTVSASLANLRSPSNLAEIRLAYEEYQALVAEDRIADEDVLRAHMQELSLLVDGEQRTMVQDTLLASEVHRESLATLKTHVDTLAERLQALEQLDRVSEHLAVAEAALAQGQVEEALSNFRLVEEGYGQGPLLDKIQDNIRRLEDIHGSYRSIQRDLQEGRVELAHEQAQLLQEGCRDLIVLPIPVELVASPEAVSIYHNGELLGETPLIVKVLTEVPLDLEVRRPGFETRKITVDSAQGAVHTVTLARQTDTVSIPGTFAAAPTVVKDSIYVASRDGKLYRWSRGSSEPQVVFAVDSLAGSVTRPVVTNRGLLYSVLEGQVFLLRHAEQEMVAVWQLDLGEQLRVDPVVVGDSVLFATDAGTLVSVDLNSGQAQWSLPHPGGKIMDSPLVANGHVHLSFAHHGIRVYRLDDQVFVSQWQPEAELATPLQQIGNELVGTTVLGQVFQYESASGKAKLLFEAEARPTAKARIDGPYFDLPLGQRLMRFDFRHSQPVKWWGNDLAVVGAPVEFADGLLLAGKDGCIYGLNEKSREPWFRSEITKAAAVAGPVPYLDHQAVLFEDGTLCIVR